MITIYIIIGAFFACGAFAVMLKLYGSVEGFSKTEIVLTSLIVSLMMGLLWPIVIVGMCMVDKL